MGKAKAKVVESEADSGATMLFDQGMEEISEINKLRNKYSEKLLTEYKATKSANKMAEIKDVLTAWKHIDAFFIARQLAAEKETDVALFERFSKYVCEAQLSFREKFSSKSNLLGEIEIDSRVRRELFSVVNTRD